MRDRLSSLHQNLWTHVGHYSFVLLAIYSELFNLADRKDLISVDSLCVQQNLTQHCKEIILQLKKIKQNKDVQISKQTKSTRYLLIEGL